jgi:Na+/proline symporter
MIMPEAGPLLKEDPQKVLPTLVMAHMPFALQVLFFGALLSALKSTASATLLAPSVTFIESIWRQLQPHMSDREKLMAMRIAVLGFATIVCGWAIASQGMPIYDMVAASYQLPLVGAFVPLVCGLYWNRATTQGAVFSVVLGIVAYLAFRGTPAGAAFPAELAGLIGSGAGMVIGSLGPQALANRHGAHYRLAGRS